MQMNQGDGQRSGIAAAEGSRAPAWLVLLLVCLGQFMVVLDISVVNVALPAIRDDLHFSQTGLQWVVNAYSIAFAGFLLLGGRAADLYGRRKMFIVGLGLFAAASLAGGLAQDKTMLVAARAIQGFGGAVLAPATLTILTTSFAEGRDRARALGIWSAMAAAGGASGALLGGTLTDLLSWRWILFINVPIGVAALVAARVVLAESTADIPANRSLDVAGALTVTGGLVSLVFGIVQTESHGWGSVDVLGPVALAAVLLVSFVWIEARVAKAPLMPLGVFRSRSLAGANVVILFIGASFFAMWYFLSLYMQTVLGFSPLKTGILFLPIVVMIILGAQIAARAVPRVGPRPLLIGGALAAAVGMWWLSGIRPDGTFVGDVLGPGLLITLGLGLAFTPVTLAATSGVARRDAGLASGLVNTTRQIGGSVGLAALATLAADRAKAVAAGAGTGPGATRVALTAGYSRAFAVGAVIAALAAAAGFLVPGRARVTGSAAPEPEPRAVPVPEP
jgi:EmrB/QacA subfamily drug resistance transporter